MRTIITVLCAVLLGALVGYSGIESAAAQESSGVVPTSPAIQCSEDNGCTADPYGPPYYGDPGHYIDRPRGEPPKWFGCNKARRIVIDNGFRNVETLGCGGKYHIFSASLKGSWFRIKVLSRSGEIVSVTVVQD